MNAASYNRLIVATTLIFVLTFLSPLAIVPLSEMTEKLLAPTPAVLTLDYVENNILSLKFTGDNILYEEAFMETVSGEIIEPLSVDSSKGVINFSFFVRGSQYLCPRQKR